MTGMRQQTRRTTVSRDGTQIVWFASGEGPPLLLVHGMTADHTRWRPLLEHLEPHVTVHAMDRRGRGESGDAAEHSLARESEDVAAVVDAVAAASGGPIDVYGHSHGGFVAYGAATMTQNIRRLVLYEGWPASDPSSVAFPPGVEDRMRALLDAGERDAVVQTLFRDVAEMPADDVASMRALPSWAARVAAAHTIPRETAAEQSVRLDPAEAARITVPVLLVTGSESAAWLTADVALLAAALPDARVVTIEGQGHVADLLVPDVFARHLLEFLGAD